ncbi:unnamed protein product [Trichobilharzia szidati]|nr:unnamed protein product [Trichobilharzia szidati]
MQLIRSLEAEACWPFQDLTWLDFSLRGRTFSGVIHDLLLKSQVWVIRLKISDFPLLTEAVNTRNYGLVAKILMEQDPFEVRRIKMLANTSKAAPNLIASQSSRRMVGCICEPEANSINWLELDKGDPVQCYCGHWFQLVNYEDYFNMTS